MSDDRIKTLNEIMSIPIPVAVDRRIPPGTIVLSFKGNVDIRCNGGVNVETVSSVDLDWEPDYAIINRLRENERRDAARIAALEAENAIWVSNWNKAEQQWAALTVECEDAKLVIAIKDVRIAELESENAAMRQALDFIRTSLSPAASSFVYAAADLPELPWRPDGTLAPVPRPLRLPGGVDPRRRMVGP